jgi:hypothetical protein
MDINTEDLYTQNTQNPIEDTQRENEDAFLQCVQVTVDAEVRTLKMMFFLPFGYPFDR